MLPNAQQRKTAAQSLATQTQPRRSRSVGGARTVTEGRRRTTSTHGLGTSRKVPVETATWADWGDTWSITVRAGNVDGIRPNVEGNLPVGDLLLVGRTNAFRDALGSDFVVDTTCCETPCSTRARRMPSSSVIAELRIWPGRCAHEHSGRVVAYCAVTGRSNSDLKNRLPRAAKMIGVKPITAPWTSRPASPITPALYRP